MKKFNLFIIIKVLFLSIFISSCDVCETSEEMSTEEYIFQIFGKNDKYNETKPSSYWVSSSVFLNKAERNQSDPSQAQKHHEVVLNVLSNDLDLCFNDYTDFHFNSSTPLIQKNKNLYKNDELEVIPLYEEIKITDCNSPPPDVYVHDIEKCENGYIREDNARVIQPYKNRVIKLEKYIVNRDNMFNAYRIGSPTILTGKKIIIPEDYYICENGECSYIFLPKLDNNAKNTINLHKANKGISLEDATKDYWCGRIPGLGQPSDKIDGYKLNEYCNNFHKFDNITYNDQGEIDKSKTDAIKCPNFSEPDKFVKSNNIGTTNNLTSKILSFISNKCIEEFENAEGNKVFQEKTLSTFFPGLVINLLDNTFNINSVLNIIFSQSGGPLSTLLAKELGSKPTYGLKELIPLKTRIKLNNNAYDILSQNVFDAGKNSIRVKRFCKASKLYIYFSNDGNPPNYKPVSINNSIYDDNINETSGLTQVDLNNIKNNIMIVDLVENDDNGNLVYKDEIILDRALIPRDGWMYFAFADNGDGYGNNNGSIKISIRRPIDKEKNFFNTFLNTILTNIETILFGNTPAKDTGVATIIYKKIVKSNAFQRIVNTLLLLFITVYSLMIVMGLTQFQSADLVKTSLKVGIIYMLISPASWDFFNKYLFDFFIRGPDNLLKLLLTDSDTVITDYSTTEKTLVFGTVSQLIGQIFDLAFYKQLISVLFAGPFGWLACIVILISFIWLLYASLNAVLIYIVAIVLIALFVSLSPLFLIMLLFKYTNKIFGAWLKIIISNALTLLFVFTGLFAIGTVVNLLLFDILGFGVCTKCVFAYDLKVIQLCLVYSALPDQFPELASYDTLSYMHVENQKYADTAGTFYGLPFSLNKILALWLVSFIMRSMIPSLIKLSDEISGIGFGGPAGAKEITNSVSENFRYWLGQNKREKLSNALKNTGVQNELDDNSKPRK